jgi:hypothetical protein
MMTQDEQSKLASTVAAHEAILSILLSQFLSNIPPRQRAELIDALTTTSSEAGPGIHLTDDIGLADQIAGLLQGHKEAVARIVKSAMARLPI